jgi:predicted XRE-type DNA-binding protein
VLPLIPTSPPAASFAAASGRSRPRLNDLLRGRIHRFNLEALIVLAERAGLTVRIDVSAAA